MKWLTALLLVILLVLQYRLWVGEGSFAEVVSLKREIVEQQLELERLDARNRALQAEVDSLKRDLEAVEERARSDLGMIRENEVFYQVIKEPRPPESGQ
jgi:cell division protein FtsB